MFATLPRCRLRATGLAAAIALAAFYLPAASQQVSLEGSWSGNGTVVFPSGDRESARCKASFRRQGGNGFAMNAVCATPSGRVSQTAELDRVSANRFAGEFHNADYGVTGSINITVQGNSLSASLNGGGATASFSLSR